MITYSLCGCCKWKYKKGNGLACKAYPDGIPNDIFGEKKDHRQNIDGDHGIKFELDESDWMYQIMGQSPDEYVNWVFEGFKAMRNNFYDWKGE